MLTGSRARGLGSWSFPRPGGFVSETRKYQQFAPDQKAEVVLAGLRGDRPVRDVCREYEIAEALYYQWRERLLEGRQGGAGQSAAEDRRAHRDRRAQAQSRPVGAGAGAEGLRAGGGSKIKPTLFGGPRAVAHPRPLRRTRALLAVPRSDATVQAGPGGHSGATLTSSAADLTPHIGTSDQPQPEPAPTTLPAPRPADTHPRPRRDHPLDIKSQRREPDVRVRRRGRGGCGFPQLAQSVS